MPNHVYHSMEITGETEALQNFVDKHFNDEHFDLNTILPMPEELEGTKSPSDEPNPELIAKYGADNWYDWKIKNWSTKWNTYDNTMDFSDKEIICAIFQTAWNTPENIFKKLAELYPELTFCLEIVEEGGYFGGTVDIVQGEVITDLTEALWEAYAILLTGYNPADDEEENENSIYAAINDLKHGNINDQGVVSEMANFIKANMEEFIKFSKP